MPFPWRSASALRRCGDLVPVAQRFSAAKVRWPRSRGAALQRCEDAVASQG